MQHSQPPESRVVEAPSVAQSSAEAVEDVPAQSSNGAVPDVEPDEQPVSNA